MTESLIHGRTMPSEFASTMTVARIEMAGAIVNSALDTTVFFSVSVVIPSFFALFPCLDEKEKRLRYDEDDDKKTESYHKAVFLKIFRDHKNTSYKISAY